MKKVIAKNSHDLLIQLSNIEADVPRRTKGRKTHHTETWIILRFLATCAVSSVWSYPIEIVHRDKPDFLISKPNGAIGLEITEAITEQYAYVFALAEKYVPDAYIEPALFMKDAPQRSKKELLSILEQSRDRLLVLFLLLGTKLKGTGQIGLLK